MDQLLGKIAAQSVSFAIKSGIGVVSSYAIREGGRYLRTIKGRDREELERLQDRLQTKIRIISPAIDLVEIISARGNTSLETAVSLTKSLRYDIQALGQRLAEANSQPSGMRSRRSKEDIKAVMEDMKAMLNRIEDAVPLINLAVTTSGVNLSASVPSTVSPSRLLQASTLLTAGDTAYAMSPFHPAQIGMTFTLTLYMLFAGHSHRKELTANDLTWQEVASKCKVKLVRAPLVFDEEDFEDDGGPGNNISATQAMRAQDKVDEYCYELCVIEDLDDGRVHEVEEGKEPPGPYEDVAKAGIRFRIPIHQISKIFYTNSGKLLGIDEANTPVLLLKRNLEAVPPRKLLDRASRYEYDFDDGSDDESGYALGGTERGDPEEEYLEDEGQWDLPKHLDPEWFAFEVWTEPIDDQSVDDEEESEEEVGSPQSKSSDRNEGIAGTISSFTGLNITSPRNIQKNEVGSSNIPPTSVTVKSNLALLECLLRLTSLQNYQQVSHLAVHDELLNLFLSDANSWLGSHETREKERENARRRIGFDPFGSPQSGDEAKESLPGTPTSGKLKIRKDGSRPTTPLRSSRQQPQLQPPPQVTRGRHMLPSTPQNRPRSESPGAQLLMESASKSAEVSYTTATATTTTTTRHASYHPHSSASAPTSAVAKTHQMHESGPSSSAYRTNRMVQQPQEETGNRR